MVLDGFRIPAMVVTLFERMSLRMVEAGHRRYSAQGVLERIRWHVAIAKRGEYKVNNNWSAPLARWFLDKNPELAGFFETRQQRSKEPTS